MKTVKRVLKDLCEIREKPMWLIDLQGRDGLHERFSETDGMSCAPVVFHKTTTVPTGSHLLTATGKGEMR